MSNGVHWSYDSLPPAVKAQVDRQLFATKTIPVVSRPPEPDSPPVVGSVRREKAAKSGTGKGGGKGGKRPSSGLSSPVRMKSRPSSGMNSTEDRFNRDVLGGLGKYEAMTFNLPGGKYTPDFAFFTGGSVVFCEVKGSYRLPSHGRSVFAFRSACAEYAGFLFCFAELMKDGAWKVGFYRGGREICSTVGGPAVVRAALDSIAGTAACGRTRNEEGLI